MEDEDIELELEDALKEADKVQLKGICKDSRKDGIRDKEEAVNDAKKYILNN